MNRRIILLMFLNISIFMNAQHQYRIGDKLQVQQITVQEFPNILGEDLTWTMQDNKETKHFANIKFTNCTETSYAANISKIVEGTNFFYDIQHDSLQLKGHRNKNISIKYDLPITEAIYPLSYGDIIQGYYAGKGILANNKYAFIVGKYSYHVCGVGKLVTLDSDTLDNTILIKNTRLVSYEEISKNMLRKKYGKLGNVPIPNNQKIEDRIKNDSSLVKFEKISWYSPGYRYAVLEINKASLTTPKGHKLFEYALYYAQEDQVQLANDTINETIRKKHANPLLHNSSYSKSASQLKECNIKQNNSNNSSKNITVSFCLEKESDVTIGVYSVNGICLYYKNYGSLQKGQHAQDISLSYSHKLANQEIIVTTFIDEKPFTKKYLYNKF